LFITSRRAEAGSGESPRKDKKPRRFARRLAIVGVGAAAVAVALAGCTSGGSGGSGGGPGKAADTATMALPPATTVNWIWPFSGLANYSVTNAEAQQMMYRPLYWFGNSKGQPLINESLSVADMPTFSNGGTTVTVKLKDYKWSNGESVTSDDVLFWFNLEKAEKANWAMYSPGEFPDNITSITAPNSSTVVFTTDKAYSQQWFLYNELSQITPMPKAWDVTGAGQPSDCATNAADCAAVYNYLNGQAKNMPSYATSPLWSVVDGPWKLSSFNSDGNASWVPNPKYSGPVKPSLKKFSFAPYTTDSAQFNVLRSGNTIDVGYIPTQDIAQAKPSDADPAAAGPNPLSKNYTLAPWFLYGINYMPYNFNNPKYGPVFKQLYFRQAMQSLVDQNGIIKTAAKNYGVLTTGPVPLYPTSPLVSKTEQDNPYPFDVAKAKSLLTGNGWKVDAGSTTTCEKPGTGAGECGAGITQGEALTFNLQYVSGQETIDTAMQDLKSNASKVGITINLTSAPFNTVIGNATACTPDQASCSWQIANWGGGWTYADDYYPSGEGLFATGAGSNSGSYSNPAMDKLIAATTTESGTAPMQAYEDALAKDLPVVWQPNYTYALTEVANGLKGVTPQNPFAMLTPESWKWQ
jgi:peptide/nickel transport system substrate-binding protein